MVASYRGDSSFPQCFPIVGENKSLTVSQIHTKKSTTSEGLEGQGNNGQEESAGRVRRVEKSREGLSGRTGRVGRKGRKKGSAVRVRKGREGSTRTKRPDVQ